MFSFSLVLLHELSDFLRFAYNGGNIGECKSKYHDIEYELKQVEDKRSDLSKRDLAILVMGLRDINSANHGAVLDD